MIFKTIDDNDSLSGQRIVSKFTARKIAQEEATKQLEIDIQCLRNYEVECQKGSVSTETFSNTMKGASIEAQKYATNIKNGTGSAQTFATNQRTIQASMSETSIVSKVAATGLSIFKAALNSLIFFSVIEGIQLLIKGIDNLILTADEAEEKAEALRGNMQSFFDEVQSGQQTISSVSDRFSELSEHVTKTGENIDLTKNEYSEYLDICNQVKTIMPELVTGYTNEGNAIIALKDNVDSLTESYKENIRTKAAAFITNGDDDGNTISSFFDDYKIFTEGENGLFAPSASGLWDNKSTDYEDYYGYDKVHEWLADVIDLGLKDLQNIQKGTTQATYLYALLKENEYELAKITEDNYEAVHDVLNTRLTSLEGEMATRVSNVKMSLQQMLYADGDYWSIDNKEALSAIDSMFNSIDAEFIKQNNLLGRYALQSFESNVIKLFEDENTQKAMINIYTPQGEAESIKDYSKRVSNAIKEFQNYVKEKKIDIPLDFGDTTDDIYSLEKSYENTINRFTEKMDARSAKQLRDAKERNDIALLSELEKKFGITDRNILSDFFTTEGINTQEEIDYFNEVTRKAKDAEDAIRLYIDALKTTSDTSSLLSISDTVDAVNNNLKPALDALKTVYQSIFTSDGFTLDDVDVSMLESLKKSFTDLKENGIDITTEDFENFTRVITDSSTTSDQAQQAFNDLATTLVENANVTLVTDDAFNTLVQTLETLGIVNAEEALQGLKEIQDEITAKGYDLANITSAEAAEFINEAKASEEAVKYLRYYMIQKQLAETPLNTSEDVKALENLCDSLGITGEMYQTVISLKNSLAAVESGAPIEAFQSSIEYARKHIAELAKGDYEFGFKFKADPKSTSGSAKDIAEEFKNLLDAELKVLDTKMDAGLINFNDYIAQRLALIQKYYDEGKIKASDYYDYLSKHYETQLSYMDNVTSYVTTRIDKEIESYNKQINQIKEKYQTEIDYLDTVIDYYEKQKEALQDANTQRELQLALQKALYDLEKAQTQRTKKLYTDHSGYIYRADGDAIRDAQDNLNKAKLDIQINEIEKAIKKVQEQQDALKKAMNNEVDVLNKIIDNLEAYKEQWNSVAKEYEEKQNEMIAQQMLGADIERQILAGRLDVLEDFKNKYLAIQQAIKDANANAAQAALNETTSPSNTGSVKSNSTSTTKPSNTLSTKELPLEDPNLKKKKIGSGRGSSAINKWQMSTYASGTDNAKPGYHEVAESGDEIIRDNYGNAFVAKGHQLHEFEGGETVYSASETQELLNGKYIPLSSCMLSDSMNKLLSLNSSEIKSLFTSQNMPDFNFSKSPTMSSNSSQREVIVTQNINVTLPNVTNESGFNNFKKELDRLKLDAYQFANKRNK